MKELLLCVDIKCLRLFCKVSMLSDRPLSKPDLKFKYYHHGLWDVPEYQPYRLDNVNAFEFMKNKWAMFQNMKKVFTAFSRYIHEDPAVQSLYERRHEFDLIIFDGLFSEVGNLFCARLLMAFFF